MSTTEVLAIISGIFNILAGLLFVASCVMFFGGLIVYLVYFGMAKKEQGVAYMEWGVGMMLFFLFILGLTRFFSAMPGVVNIIVAVVILFVVLKVIATELSAAPAGDKKKEATHG